MGHSKLMAIELAVSEVVINAIKHGGATSCKVSFANERDLYCIMVEDNGTPFNPLEPTVLPLGELRGGGYGLAIVQQVTDHLCYEHNNKSNKLTLKFRNTPHTGG